MTLAVEATGLQLRYGEVTALDDLSFSLPGGRIYGLLGRNGSGKTSLLSVLAGFRKASGGTVLVDGQPVFENPRATRRVCLIRETGDTGYKDDRVSYALYTARRLRAGWDADYAAALVDRFQIPMGKQLGELSLGQRSALGLTFGLPFVGGVVDVADVPLAATVGLCLAGLLPGAAVIWALVRDIPIRNRTA